MRSWMNLCCAAGAGAALLAGASVLGATEQFGPFETSDPTMEFPPPERRTDFMQQFAVPKFDDMGGARTLKSIKITYSLGLRFFGQGTNTGPSPAAVTINFNATASLLGPGLTEVLPVADSQGPVIVPGTPAPLPDRTLPVNRSVSVADVMVFIDSGDFGDWTGVGTLAVFVTGVGGSMFSASGNFNGFINTVGSGVFTVLYEFNSRVPDCTPDDREPNDFCAGFTGDCNVVDFAECDQYIDGKLEKRLAIGCEPDTYLVLFNKQGVIINRDDNGSDKGNGWASGLDNLGFYIPGGPVPPSGDGQAGLIPNGDGTFSLRLGVTGRADGLDGNFNGFFQNAPHGQHGKFIVCVEFKNGEGNPIFPAILPDGSQIANPAMYTDEFITGAEAFHINYTAPLGTVKVDVNIENVVPCEEVRNDVDFYCPEGLVPLCDYCITQVGGINCECEPTALCLGWFDKDCQLILSASGNGVDVPEYAVLCLIADANGKALIAVSGSLDCDFDGVEDPGDPTGRAPVECPEHEDHGEAGCYTLCVMVVGQHAPSSPSDQGESGAGADSGAMEAALDRGDVNMDGAVNTADLGILLGSFGWTAP